MKKPELLSPAANVETLKTVIRYGADAVYIGGEAFSLRAKADNFTAADMQAGIEYAHAHGAKVYVTANIYAHNADLPEIAAYFKELSEAGPDALLISDPGVYVIAKRFCPEIPVHISTQANNTNYETFRFWYDAGVRRVVTARELSLSEIKEIRERIPPDMEIESFVHGAMCISYSGRCLLSRYYTGRDANHGECTHPCRWRYQVMEATRPGQYEPVEETERGTFLFNSRDLNMISHLPALIEAGIDSFKIEGRMKSALYAATVTRAYRLALDDWFSDPKRYEAHLPRYEEELRSCTFRPYGTGFYFGEPKDAGVTAEAAAYESEGVYLGTVETVTRDGRLLLTQKNKFSVGDMIEIMKPDGENVRAKVLTMYDEEGQRIESCPHAKMPFSVRLSYEAAAGDLLRKRRDNE